MRNLVKMRHPATFSVSVRIKRQSAVLTRVMAGLSMVAILFTANAATSVQQTAHQPMLLSNVPSNTAANTNVVRLEIYLKRRQAVLYQNDVAIKRYPIGTGRKGWETPKGTFRVMEMSRNPGWINPFTNEDIPPNDPRNPLRGYWIGFWTNGTDSIGFHGTLDTSTVGKAASHGCLHMYDSDLKDLFSRVSLGTQVKVLP